MIIRDTQYCLLPIKFFLKKSLFYISDIFFFCLVLESLWSDRCIHHSVSEHKKKNPTREKCLVLGFNNLENSIYINILYVRSFLFLIKFYSRLNKKKVSTAGSDFCIKIKQQHNVLVLPAFVVRYNVIILCVSFGIKLTFNQ